MSAQDDPPQADFEETSTQLKRGLNSCRSLMRNYRAVLGDHRDAERSDDAPAEDRSTGD